MLNGSKMRVVKRDKDNCNRHQKRRDSVDIKTVNSTKTSSNSEIEFDQTKENINFDRFDGSAPKSTSFSTKL
jgi:hypothetical protein